MTKPIITINNLTKVALERVILRDVSCSIDQQSLVSLIGPNGAGKSTLVKILLGFDHDYTGEVWVHPDERIAYIPQIDPRDPNPIPLSVTEYLHVGVSRLYGHAGVHTTTQDLEAALEHVGVGSDKLGQSFWSLSGGERQRVAIARALLSQPTTLVLDEPLSAVDYASREGLYQLIRHLQQDHKMTVLLVSHDIDSVLPISDRILCLNQTLHTNCHPQEYTSDTHTQGAQQVHHHC